MVALDGNSVAKAQTEFNARALVFVAGWTALSPGHENKSMDDHPIHLHRHTFEIRRLEDGAEIAGLRKDVVLVHAGGTVEVEFVADNPGKTLLHCDRGPRPLLSRSL